MKCVLKSSKSSLLISCENSSRHVTLSTINDIFIGETCGKVNEASTEKNITYRIPPK